MSSLRLAVRRAETASSLFCASTAESTLRREVLRSDLIALLRRRAFSLVRMRFFWDLMFATIKTFFLSNWSVRANADQSSTEWRGDAYGNRSAVPDDHRTHSVHFIRKNVQCSGVKKRLIVSLLKGTLYAVKCTAVHNGSFAADFFG